jgi:hypothetical protein
MAVAMKNALFIFIFICNLNEMDSIMVDNEF